MSEKLRVTLVQTDLEWDNPLANRRHLDYLLEDIVATDVIVLPELFTTAFCMESAAEEMMGESMQWMRCVAKEKGAAVCGSLIIQENGQQFNRFIWTNPDGTIEQYDKRHLFSLMGEDSNFSAGSDRKIITYKGWKICPQICYDLRFPVYSRNNLGFDLLIYVANWPLRRIEAWDRLLPARAIENQSYVVAVNRTGADGNAIAFNGHSAVYDAFGERLEFVGDEERVATIMLDKGWQDQIREKLPFLQDGDGFTLSR